MRDQRFDELTALHGGATPRRVRDLMRNRVVTGSRDDCLTEIAARMHRERVGAVILLDGWRLIGIITEHDLVGAMAEGRDPRVTAAAEYMTAQPMTVRPNDSLAAAAGLMTALGARHLPVVEDGRPVGFLSARDVLRTERRAPDLPDRPSFGR